MDSLTTSQDAIAMMSAPVGMHKCVQPICFKHSAGKCIETLSFVANMLLTHAEKSMQLQ